MLSKVIEVLTFGKFYLGNKKDILIFDAKSSAFLENFLKFVNTIFYSRNEKLKFIFFSKQL